MELLVHVSISGHLLVACTQVMLLITMVDLCNVRVIMGTLSDHLLLWEMTISVKVFSQPMITRSISFASLPMLLSGMARFVRVVATAVSSTILHGSPRT